MIHPASRLEVVVHSRADGRSAVKSAAYTSRSTFNDERLGRKYRSGKLGGLLSHELINWAGDAETLWNAAERAENRSNARVIRELRPSLPAELPLSEQVRLVRGFSLWLRDEYGVAVQADIHAPRFLDRAEERLHRAGKLAMGHSKYMAAIFDPAKTNLNFHSHILMTTRQVCGKAGTFGVKTRKLDDKKDGPKEILRIRQEWENRTNALLKEIGSSAQVDLRSYIDMAKAGDAPEGLIPQEHLGPRRSELSRREAEESKEDDKDDEDASGAERRAEIRAYNEELWKSWLELRALEREKDLQEAEQLAREREVARKKKADAERRRLLAAQNDADAERVLSEATQFDSLKTGSALSSALAWALGEQCEPPCAEPDWASSLVDLETYEPPQGPPQPEPFLELKMDRVQGPRSR